MIVNSRSLVYFYSKILNFNLKNRDFEMIFFIKLRFWPVCSPKNKRHWKKNPLTIFSNHNFSVYIYLINLIKHTSHMCIHRFYMYKDKICFCSTSKNSIKSSFLFYPNFFLFYMSQLAPVFVRKLLSEFFNSFFWQKGLCGDLFTICLS